MSAIPPDYKARFEDAMNGLRAIFPDDAVMCIVAIDIPGGVHVCSAANISHPNQMQLMEILLESFDRPDNATLN